MVVGGVFLNCYNSPPFPARIAGNSVNAVILKKKFLMRFQICLLKQGHVYVWVFKLFTELMSLPKNAIRIKWCDFEGRMKSTGHFAP
jgi:hypothetical protein